MKPTSGTLASRVRALPVPVVMALKTTVATALVTSAFMLSGLLDPVDLLIAGDVAWIPVIERDFPHAELVPGIGHDGQMFYAIAVELPDLHAAAEQLDEPRYRLLRIFTPLVASVAPDGDAIVLVLLALNLVGLGLAVGGLASLCEQSGRDPTFGWLALVPTLLPAYMSVADPLATGLTLAALALVLRNRLGLASAVFAVGCLTREGVAVTVAAAALVLLVQRRRVGPSLVVGLSALPLLAWYLYLTAEIGGQIPDRWSALALLRMPATTGALVVVCFVVGIVGTWGWRAQPVVAAAAATQAVQVPFLFEDILLPFNLTRVIAVALSLGLVVLAGAWIPAGLRAARPA